VIAVRSTDVEMILSWLNNRLLAICIVVGGFVVVVDSVFFHHALCVYHNGDSS
jgi:hypothetical protein